MMSISRYRRAVGRQLITPLQLTLLLLIPVHRASAQEREGDAERRRQALLEQWDGGAPGVEPTSGVSFAKWLQATGGAQSASWRASVAVPGTQQWVSVGPRGFYGDNGFFGSLPQLDAGRIPALAFHPTDRFTIYAGTSAGGVWKLSLIHI